MQYGSIIILVAFIAVFYFFGIRPQRKQEKEAAEMRNNLVVGDEVTTIGGIIGKIVSIKEETFVLETTRDHTRIRFLKSAVRSVDVHAEDIPPRKKETPAENAPEEDNAPQTKKKSKKPVTEAETVTEPVTEVEAPAAETAETNQD